MADELQSKVSAREVLGTAWEATRKCRPVDESDIRIEVQYVNPDRSQQELTPLDGRADTEEIGKLYGNGRFFLKAKRKSDATVISTTTVDIKDAAPHPMDVAAQLKPAATAGRDDELFGDDKDDRIGRLEDAIAQLAEKISTPLPAPGSSLMERVMEKLLMEKLDGKSNDVMQQPEVMGAIIKNALDMQSKIAMSNEDMRLEDHRLERDLRLRRDEIKLDREEVVFQAKQKLLLENAKAVVGQSAFDPQGNNTLALLEVIQDFLGVDGSTQIFGVKIADILEPVVPQITKALQDRDIYVMAKAQLEQLLKHQYDQGRAMGQQEALEELTEPGETEEKPAEGSSNGSDGGSGIPRTEDNPGPDDQAGSAAGGRG